MNFLKRGFIFTAVFSLLASIVASAQIPKAYWQYQVPFQEAVASNNKDEILRTSNAIIDIFKDQPLDSDKAGIMFISYEALYPIYESMGQYDKAIECLKEYRTYGEYLNFADAVKIADKRIEKIDPMTEVYALTQDTSKVPYYGAKNEPKNGTYWGRVHSPVSGDPLSDESIISFYVECLQDNIWDFDYIIRPYDNGERTIHIALNMPYENSSLSSVMQSSSDEYLKRTMEYIASLDSPVLLRIGGEMNVWQNLAEPELFKQAYIKIANMARSYAPNAALVFSPNDVSNWDTSIESYYPGDAYVDWVGCSLYTNKYMSASNPVPGEDFSEMFYGNGAYANPIAKLREIVELYGDKKPIIITEGGSGHLIRGGEDLSDFAKNRMNILYTYVNMVYPQVKGIIYFDHDLSSSPYDYALSHSQKVKDQYMASTGANKAFIKNGSAQYAYVKAENYSDNLSEISLYTYCVLPGSIIVKADYYIDDVNVGSSSSVPYACTISTSSISEGSHSLKVVVSGENGYNETKEYSLVKNAGGVVTITAR